MPLQNTRPAPTMYDALGRPLVNKALQGGVKYGFRNYVQPVLEKYFGSTATEAGSSAATSAGTEAGTAAGTGAATEGAATGAAAAGGESALGSMGGLTWASIAPYIPVVGVAYMAWNQYQKGSGVNEPVYKQYQTRGGGRMLADMIAGKKIDPYNTYAEYGLRAKTLPSYLDPNSAGSAGENYTPGTETLDPRGYTPFELYDLMHHYSTGRPQTGGLGNSGYSPQQIDDMFGSQKGSLAKLLGVDALPDWSKWGGSQKGFSPDYQTPWSVNHPQVKSDAGWKALAPEERHGYMEKAKMEGAFGEEGYAQQLWDMEQQRKEVGKLLGWNTDSLSDKGEMGLDGMLGYRSSGGGNPNPGSSQPFDTRYPTAMTDSGEYTASVPPPGSNVVEAYPDGLTLYQIRQLMNQKRNMQGI